jgi:hypothetical protein
LAGGENDQRNGNGKSNKRNSVIVYIPLPDIVATNIVPTVDNQSIDPVPNDDVSNVITQIFINKTFKLYKYRSVANIAVNLSQRVLSDSENEVLSKGVTFCPTEGEPDFGQLWSDLKGVFFRRLRTKKQLKLITLPLNELANLIFLTSLWMSLFNGKVI